MPHRDNMKINDEANDEDILANSQSKSDILQTAFERRVGICQLQNRNTEDKFKLPEIPSFCIVHMCSFRVLSTFKSV